MMVIEVYNLSKSYRHHVAVEHVSFSVKEGEIFGIVGPYDAGKTTTVECIEGLRKPDGGSVRVLGYDPRQDGAELRQSVGAQLQASELPEKLRVGEALALVGSPEVAVLDELTTGLDPQAGRETWGRIEKIGAGGVTVLLVTHFMAEAERLCDRVAVIDSGRVSPRHPRRPHSPGERRAARPVPAVRALRREAAEEPTGGERREPAPRRGARNRERGPVAGGDRRPRPAWGRGRGPRARADEPRGRLRGAHRAQDRRARFVEARVRDDLVR